MKKKILFLINTLSCGGAEKVLLDTVNNLPCEEFDITLQTIKNIGVFQNQINNCVRYKTICKKGFLGTVFYFILRFILPAKYVYDKYIKDDYDIEVAFLEGMPTKIISYSTNDKAKKIAWVHTDFMTSFQSKFAYRSYKENKLAYERFDKIACVSDDVKDKFIERFGKEMEAKTKTVYNIFLDEEIKRKGDERLNNVDHKYSIIVSCGRLCKQKAFDRLLRIHKKLLDEGIKQYLWIVGGGPLRSKYEEYIEKNKLESTVILWGFQSNPYKYIKEADLFVCSSIAEGYSTVITESVVLKTPVISVDVAGAREPKDFSRCYRVVDNNEESLYEEIKEILLNKEELEKAKDYTELISGNFKKEDYLKKIISFLGE